MENIIRRMARYILIIIFQEDVPVIKITYLEAIDPYMVI